MVYISNRLNVIFIITSSIEEIKLVKIFGNGLNGFYFQTETVGYLRCGDKIKLKKPFYLDLFKKKTKNIVLFT